MFNLVYDETTLDEKQLIIVKKGVVLLVQETAQLPPKKEGGVRVTLNDVDNSDLLGLGANEFMFCTSLILVIPASVTYDWVAILLNACYPYMRAIYLECRE